MRRARLLDSAAYRIAVACAGAFALANLALGGLVFLAAHRAVVAQVENQIAEDSATLSAEFREGGRRELAASLAEREAGTSANELVYAVFAPDGRRILGEMQAARPAAGWSDIAFRDPFEGEDSARALAVDLSDGTRLVVAADKENIERIDSAILSLFGFAMAMIALFGVGAAFLIGRYLKVRLGAVGSAADAIVAGHLHERVPVGPRNDEFDRLAATLNAMLDRIGELMTNLRQVSGDIAHDLRTPLARLRQQLELSLAQPAEAAAQRAVIEDACARIDEVLGLFAAILRISALEGSPRRAFGSIDLTGFVADLCEDYAPAVEDGGRQLDWVLASGCTMEGDRALLSQGLINLIDNAQIHTPPGTAIEVTLGRSGGQLRLTVADRGPGVPEADRARIVQRFIRLEASRTTAGHGLGLNLVQAIARAHGGQIEIADNAPGLRVTLALPASADDGTPGQARAGRQGSSRSS